MRQLLLLRHAKAVWDQRRFSDRERPLTAGGERAAAALGRAMAALGMRPECVLVSPAERAGKTLAHLGLPLAPAAPREGLYLAGAGEILRELTALSEDVRSVLVVGHNPGLHELAEFLLSPAGGAAESRLRRGFPTATLVEFSVPVPWRELGRGAAQLVRFLSPHDVPGAPERTPAGGTLFP